MGFLLLLFLLLFISIAVFLFRGIYWVFFCFFFQFYAICLHFDIEIIRRYISFCDFINIYLYECPKRFVLFVCVDVLRPSERNGVISSAFNLHNHTFTGQA